MRTPGQAISGRQPPEKNIPWLGCLPPCSLLATALSPLCTAGDVKQESKGAARERTLP